MNFYTKLVITVQAPDGQRSYSIKEPRWDLGINDIKDVIESVLLAAGYAPESVAEIFCDEDNNCCEGCLNIPEPDVTEILSGHMFKCPQCNEVNLGVSYCLNCNYNARFNGEMMVEDQDE